MSNLTRYENDGIEVYIDRETGESFYSVRGYARTVGMSSSSITHRLSRNTDDKNQTKMAEVLTDAGLRSVRLIPESLIAEWVKSDNPELAARMLGAGVRAFLYRLAGIQLAPLTQADQDLQAIKRTTEATNEMLALFLGEVTELRRIKAHSQSSMPGLEVLLNNLPSQPLLPTEDLITVKGWLATKGITLEKGKLNSFARRVSSVYRATTQQIPIDDSELVGLGYPLTAIPMFEFAWAAFLPTL